MTAPRVLISTISARTGGVPVMVRFAMRVLRNLGAEPVVAYYQPYSMSPALSVPAFALGRRRPGSERADPVEGAEAHAIGAWLPELEFTTYRPHRHWRAVMESCDAHIAVSGNILAALPFAATARPYLAWIASDWHGDRTDRVRGFGLARRTLDTLAVRPVMRSTERRLLRDGHIVALSEYTAQRLSQAAGIASPPVCPTPVDAVRFRPDAGVVEPRHIVFCGRLDDARKNLALLFNAVAELVRQGGDYRLTLCGGGLPPLLETTIERLGLRARVTVLPYVDQAELVQLLQRADVFALPSHQEGLCIAALEAMACGTPVVSTRCGGPEEYVLPGANGELTGFDVAEMAEALKRVAEDRARRELYAGAARLMVQLRYGAEVAESCLRTELLRVFPQLAR